MSERVIVTRPWIGICYMQVCAVPDATDEEILDVANRENPSGTQNGWTHVVRESDEGAPVPCDDDPVGRSHFLVEC